jgi:hypothetical protein
VAKLLWTLSGVRVSGESKVAAIIEAEIFRYFIVLPVNSSHVRWTTHAGLAQCSLQSHSVSLPRERGFGKRNLDVVL